MEGVSLEDSDREEEVSDVTVVLCVEVESSSVDDVWLDESSSELDSGMEMSDSDAVEDSVSSEEDD